MFVYLCNFVFIIFIICFTFLKVSLNNPLKSSPEYIQAGRVKSSLGLPSKHYWQGTVYVFVCFYFCIHVGILICLFCMWIVNGYIFFSFCSFILNWEHSAVLFQIKFQLLGFESELWTFLGFHGLLFCCMIFNKFICKRWRYYISIIFQVRP